MERSRAEPEVLKLAPANTARVPASSANPIAASIFALQRAAGNLATTELLRELQRREQPPAPRPSAGTAGSGDHAAEAAQPASLHVLDHLRLQRAVASWAGDWDTLHYKTTKDALKNPIGVDIAIEFKPGDKVDSTGIGIAQGVLSADLGAPLAINKAIGARSIAKGPMKGFHLDQLDQDAAGKDITNPLYPSAAAKKGDELGTTGVVPMATPGGGRHGWRFVDKKGKENKLSAQMNDAPALPGHGANAKQIFETTAMAFSGHQTGTYYGSVSWGWETNAKGKFHRLPFTLLSSDVPTGTFATAVGLWNASKNVSGAAHMRLPMALGRWTSIDGTQVVKNPAKAVDTELAKLVKNTRVEVTTKGSSEKFNKGKDHWWKVTVTQGPQIGLVGWSLAGSLADKKVP